MRRILTTLFVLATMSPALADNCRFDGTCGSGGGNEYQYNDYGSQSGNCRFDGTCSGNDNRRNNRHWNDNGNGNYPRWNRHNRQDNNQRRPWWKRHHHRDDRSDNSDATDIILGAAIGAGATLLIQGGLQSFDEQRLREQGIDPDCPPE